MNLYHGTGRDRLDGLLRGKPRRTPRPYLGGRLAFSTTTDFEIAALFALRRSHPSLLSGDESGAGVVLEYSLDERKPGWCDARCPGVLQDEKEVAILRDGILTLVAVWTLKDGDWARQELRRLGSVLI